MSESPDTHHALIVRPQRLNHINTSQIRNNEREKKNTDHHKKRAKKLLWFPRMLGYPQDKRDLNHRGKKDRFCERRSKVKKSRGNKRQEKHCRI